MTEERVPAAKAVIEADGQVPEPVGMDEWMPIPGQPTAPSQGVSPTVQKINELLKDDPLLAEATLVWLRERIGVITGLKLRALYTEAQLQAMMEKANA